MRVDDHLGRKAGTPDGAHLPVADELGERSQRLVEIGVLIGPVHLVEVDVVGIETSQAVLDGAGDPARGASAVVVIGAPVHRQAELGRKHDVAAAVFQRLADDLF